MRRVAEHAHFFFFNDTATTEIYTLSLHDALPICARALAASPHPGRLRVLDLKLNLELPQDRKSLRLNSSHANISYAVLCLKKNLFSYFPTSIFSPLR